MSIARLVGQHDRRLAVHDRLANKIIVLGDEATVFKNAVSDARIAWQEARPDTGPHPDGAIHHARTHTKQQ